MLLGAAARENGVLRLMKALRHEAPGIEETAKRLGVPASKEALGYVFKTLHSQHGGKLSLTRLLAGHLDDGATLQSASGGSGRISGILAVNGAYDTKRAAAEAGDTVALAKVDPIKTGDTVSSGKSPPAALSPRSRRRRCSRSRSPPPTARTTSSSARPLPGCTRRILRSAS